jgi:hypothetical protein
MIINGVATELSHGNDSARQLEAQKRRAASALVAVAAVGVRSIRWDIHHNVTPAAANSCPGRPSARDLTSSNGGRQAFCNASRKAIVSRCNSATVLCSLRFSAWRNARRLIGRQPYLPRLCSCKRDSTFPVFNTHIVLIRAPLYV